MPWTPNVPIPDQLSRTAPGMAAFNGELHLVHAGDSSNRIWWSRTSDGQTWTPNVQIVDQLSKGASALASFGGRLHIVHQGDSSNNLWHSSTDGTRWTTNERIAGESAQSPPALAAFGGLLHCLHNGDSSHRLYHLTFDGTRWTKRPDDPGLRGQLSKGAVALAEFGGLLHMVHQGDSSDQLWHSTFDGSTWTPNVQIPNQFSKSPPALAELNGLLHLVHLGDSSNRLWHSTFDGTGWADNIAIPDQLSKSAAALAAFNGRLHLVHLGDSSNQLWHSSSDGVLVRRPERRVVIIDLDGLRWDTFYAHLKTVTDAGAGLDASYTFTLPAGASDDTVLGKGGKQLNSAFAELCLGAGAGMVDVRMALTGYPSFTFPMHATMYTGCWPGRHGVAGNAFLVRDAPPEFDHHEWESLPRALSLAGFCTNETGEFGAFLDYLWGGFDQVSAGACRNRNRGLNSDLRVPTCLELAEAAGLRTCAIHSFYHGATQPWQPAGKDSWWHYDAHELRSVKDICSDADIDQLETVDHAMFTKAGLLTRFRPSSVRVAHIPPTVGVTADRLNGAPRGNVPHSGEPHPDGIPDLIALYAASIDEACHTQGVRNRGTHLAWFDHRLARFARELRAADPQAWERTIFALVADHGHQALTNPERTDGMPRSTLHAVREDLLRLLFGDAEAQRALDQLDGKWYADLVIAGLLRDEMYALNQAMNLYVYLREPDRFPPLDVARRLLALTAPTEPYGALVLIGDDYLFLARGESDARPLTDPASRATIQRHLDPPGSTDGDVIAVSLTAADEAAERELRRRLGTAEGFDLLRVAERVAGFQPDGNRSMPDVILLAPTGRTFTSGPATHGSFGYSTSRIPMVFFGPGMPEGRRTLEQADLVDFAPTVLALLGLPVPTDIDGRPLLGLDGTDAPAVRSGTLRGRDRRLRIIPVPAPATPKRRVLREVAVVPAGASVAAADRTPVLVGLHVALAKPEATGLRRGAMLRALLDDGSGPADHLLQPCTLELSRMPRWLTDVLRAAGSAPGVQLVHDELPGVTLTADQFARLVGGLDRLLSNRRVVPDLPDVDLTPDGGLTAHPGEFTDIDLQPDTLGAGSVADQLRDRLPGRLGRAIPLTRDDAAVRLTDARTVPGRIGRANPGEPLEEVSAEPDRPRPRRDRPTPIQQVDDAFDLLQRLFDRTAFADLALPARHC